jgi:hypothetical protein
MKLFKKFTISRKAKRFAQAAHLLSASSTIPILNTCPAIDELFHRPGFNIKVQWDFFMTCACLGAGIFLYGKNNPTDLRSFVNAVIKSAEKWDKQAPYAIDDCQQFILRGISNGADIETSIGSWVVWNLKGSAPTEIEFGATATIGSLIVKFTKDIL